MENAKIENIKCDILGDFQTLIVSKICWDIPYLFLARVFQEVILIHQWVIHKIHMELEADEMTRLDL